MKKYDIVKEATKLVENQLALLQALYEAKRTLEDGRSRRVCRCGSCRRHRAITLTWVASLLGQEQAEQNGAEQAAVAAPAKSDASLPTDQG
jgi:hypothetical protein